MQTHVPISPALVSVDLNVLQSLSALVNDFASPNTPESPNYVSSSWFSLLPSIYGQNRALDATIKSFAAQHFGRSLQNQQMTLYAKCAYGEALHWLRKSLMNPPESLSSNVFCAVVLLCMYEVTLAKNLFKCFISSILTNDTAFYEHGGSRVLDEARKGAGAIGQGSRARPLPQSA